VVGKRGTVPRTLSILFPDRETEYWFTERVFVVGDRLERNGATWVVTSVGATDGKSKHMSVTVRPDGDGAAKQAGLFAEPS
jgi:hypothetical protein